MIRPNRAEIELVAIAMYESHCRSCANYGVDTSRKIYDWLRAPGWTYLDTAGRREWRTKAVAMLKEDYVAG